MGSPERWLLEDPKGGRGYAMRNLASFAETRMKQGWKIIGQTVDGSDQLFAEPLTDEEVVGMLPKSQKQSAGKADKSSDDGKGEKPSEDAKDAAA